MNVWWPRWSSKTHTCTPTPSMRLLPQWTRALVLCWPKPLPQPFRCSWPSLTTLARFHSSLGSPGRPGPPPPSLAPPQAPSPAVPTSACLCASPDFASTIVLGHRSPSIGHCWPTPRWPGAASTVARPPRGASTRLPGHRHRPPPQWFFVFNSSLIWMKFESVRIFGWNLSMLE
jgi:hypothetical protein